MHTIARRVAQVGAAIALAVAMMGAQSPSCGGGVSSDRPPVDRQVNPATAKQAVIRVTEATGPYEIYVMAHEVGKTGGDHTRMPAVGQYKQTLDYTSGKRIEIRVNVTGNDGDMFSCEITDGWHKARDRGVGHAFCTLTTSQ